MSLVHERLFQGNWLVPPWARWQHIYRYQWAAGTSAALRILDAACGSGYGALILATSGAGEVFGVDISEEAVTHACRKNQHQALRFCIGDVTALPFPDGYFDLYVSFETIEHLEDDGPYLREAARVLKPGGTFLCSTPNRALGNPGTRLEDRPYNPFHTREFTLDELRERLGRWFSSIRFYGQSPFSHRYVAALDRVGRRRPMLAVRLHQLRKTLGLPVDGKRRHWPAPLPLPGEPEVLIAECRL